MVDIRVARRAHRRAVPSHRVLVEAAEGERRGDDAGAAHAATAAVVGARAPVREARRQQRLRAGGDGRADGLGGLAEPRPGARAVIDAADDRGVARHVLLAHCRRPAVDPPRNLGEIARRGDAFEEGFWLLLSGVRLLLSPPPNTARREASPGETERPNLGGMAASKRPKLELLDGVWSASKLGQKGRWRSAGPTRAAAQRLCGSPAKRANGQSCEQPHEATRHGVIGVDGRARRALLMVPLGRRHLHDSITIATSSKASAALSLPPTLRRHTFNGARPCLITALMPSLVPRATRHTTASRSGGGGSGGTGGGGGGSGGGCRSRGRRDSGAVAPSSSNRARPVASLAAVLCGPCAALAARVRRSTPLPVAPRENRIRARRH